MQLQVENYSATFFAGWQDSDGVADHQRLRKQLFVDHLGWELYHRQGREIDEFDTALAVYCLLRHDDHVIGGWRATRTTQEYLSRKVFPDLCKLRPYPTNPDIWEISRLGVLPRYSGTVSAGLLYGLMVDFARSRGARSLIGVVDVSHARRMSTSGLKIRRFGAPEEVGRDVAGRPIRAFLAELRPAEQAGRRFDDLMALLDWLERTDEALFLGPESVPA